MTFGPRTAIGAVVLAGLLAGPPVAGTTLAPAPIEVLAREASRIVWGRVEGRSFEPVPGRPVATRTRLEVVVWEDLDGLDAPGESLEVVVPGGRRGDLVTYVAEAPALSPGDEVVLLLDETPWGLQPLGLSLGVRSVDVHGRIAGDGRRVLPFLDALRVARLGRGVASPPPLVRERP